MPDLAPLSISLGPFRLRTPVLLASGCCGYGPELAGCLPMEEIGGFVTKTVTLRPRPGNPPPRVRETAGGMLNSIGLENVGLERFLSEKLPQIRRLPPFRVVSLGGYQASDYAEQAGRLDGQDGFEALELNLSCPNVAQGGLDLGTDPARVREAVRAVRERTGKFLIAKLTPNTQDVVALGRAAEEGGADAVSAINTLVGTGVDWHTRTAMPSPGSGGLSGPAIRPVALAMVWKLSRALQVPVIGIGGIMDARDVLEFVLAGASAVQVGTALFLDPSGARVRAAALRGEMDILRVGSCESLRGNLEKRSTHAPPREALR